MTSPSERYDPWYAKAAFGVFLFGLVGSLIALYSGASDPILAGIVRCVALGKTEASALRQMSPATRSAV